MGLLFEGSFVVGESIDEREYRNFKEGLDSKIKLLLCSIICKAIQSICMRHVMLGLG